MKVEEFKQKTKIRLISSCFLMVASALMLAILLILHMLRPEDEIGVAFLHGYQSGLTSGLLLLSIFHTVKHGLILTDELWLNKYYIKESDERNQAICQRSGMKNVGVLAIIFIFLSVISGYINFGAMIAFIVASLITSLLKLSLYIYYSKTI